MDEVLREELNILFKSFSNEVSKILGENLELIVIYGSVVLDDFRRGKGDIDFLCIVKNNLTHEEIEKIKTIHYSIREGSLGELGIQLEGAYYTVAMVKNFKENVGRGFYLGTNEKRWKEVDKVNSLNFIDTLMIMKKGRVIYGGQDAADYFNEPKKEEMKNEFIRKLRDNIELSKQIDDIYFSIEMVYFAVRGLNTIVDEGLTSKGQATEWFISNYLDSEWINLVKYTSNYRYPLTKDEEDTIDKIFINSNTTEFLTYIYDTISAH